MTDKPKPADPAPAPHVVLSPDLLHGFGLGLAWAALDERGRQSAAKLAELERTVERLAQELEAVRHDHAGPDATALAHLQQQIGTLAGRIDEVHGVIAQAARVAPTVAAPLLQQPPQQNPASPGGGPPPQPTIVHRQPGTRRVDSRTGR